MIELINVSKTYPKGQQAVKNVSFTVKEAEIFVLVGPSGCGKTTTLKMINRLIQPSSGKILIRKKDINNYNPIRLRRDIGYVIQEIGLFPHLTVGENIGLVPRLKKWPKAHKEERISDLLEMIGLEPDVFINRYPIQLSGGQRQRVGVARALAADPQIVLMDEPFGALDPISKEQLQDEFLKLQRKLQKTVVFVTHDIMEAIKLGDRLAIMRNGTTVQIDSPANVINNPADDFVREFLGGHRFQIEDKTIRIEKVIAK